MRATPPPRVEAQVRPTSGVLTPTARPERRQTAGFQVINPGGAQSSHAEYVRKTLPRALEYVARRTDRRIKPPLTVVVSGRREDNRCAVRGLALPGADQIYLYVAEETPRRELRIALVHELGHVLQHQAAGGDVASVTLAEGFATYVSAEYWPLWDRRSGFQGAVRRYREQGRYVPLTQDNLPCDTATRDRLYTERAAFVEWLLRTYGSEKFWRLNRLAAQPSDVEVEPGELPYVTPPTIRHNPSYEHAPWERVYGQPLETLEQRWLDSLSYQFGVKVAGLVQRSESEAGAGVRPALPAPKG